MKIVHVISGLNQGGAESMLVKLVAARSRDQDVEVVSLTDRGVLGSQLESLGVPLHTLQMPRGRPSLRGLLALTRLLRQVAPTVVQCWMYHGNLIGGLAAKAGSDARIIWGIRNSALDPATTSRATRCTVWAGARLSRSIPNRIVCCSNRARDMHVAMGYDPARTRVIPNGFDTQRFKPNAEHRLDVRRELGLPEDSLLIGMAGRLDPQKDHGNFIAAAGHVTRVRPDVHFVLIGEGVDRKNVSLTAAIERAGLTANFRLLGRREDMPRLTAALDIASLSSAYGEAFPNVLGEAMACEVPCVATDVGDSAQIVGDTGITVPPRDAPALAAAWLKMIEAGATWRHTQGLAARRRVEACFALPAVVALYEQLYVEVAGSARKPEPALRRA